MRTVKTLRVLLMNVVPCSCATLVMVSVDLRQRIQTNHFFSLKQTKKKKFFAFSSLANCTLLMFRLQHDWFRSFESQGDDKFWVVDPDGTKYIVKTNAGKVVDAPQDLTVLHSNGVMSVSTRTSTVKAHSPLATSSVSSYANLTAATVLFFLSLFLLSC